MLAHQILPGKETPHPGAVAGQLYVEAVQALSRGDRPLAVERLIASLSILLELSASGDSSVDPYLTCIAEEASPCLFADAVKALPRLLAYRITGGAA
jgi:hypothetical protein